ncbi:MAG TPA: cell division protein CrgA [Acidimicrobiia bacterium]|jgi:high-affinity Fe2+/Pb2+ permease|nr:cell division protein CrgA [Acidimicrobiia bacterium]
MPESKRRKPKAAGPTPSKRPVPKDKPESPSWYVAVMAGLMGVGVVLVLVRFFLRTDEWLLLVGLVLISAGFIMTTNYR